MRTVFVVVAALAGCGNKDASEQIKKAESAPEAERPKLFCELAKKASDKDVAYSLVSRLATHAAENVPADAPVPEDVDCIAKALGALKEPPDYKAELTRLRFKRPKATAIVAQYDALPDRKDQLLEAWAHFGGHWEDWHVSAPHAVPAMLAELDKLGATGDPRYFAGLAGAVAYGDTLPGVRDRYAKVAKDPKMLAGWEQALRAEGSYANEGHYTDGFVRLYETALRELETHHGKLPEGVQYKFVVACGQPKANCVTTGKLDEDSRKGIEYGMGSYENYEWSAKARAFVESVKQGGGPVDDLTLTLKELEAQHEQYMAQMRRNGRFEEEAPDTTDLDRKDPVVPAFDETVAKLAAGGPANSAKLVEVVKTGSFAPARAAARALAKSDTAALAKHAREVLASYAQLSPKAQSADFGSFGYMHGLGHALVALRDAPGDAATHVYLELLSSLDPRLSGYATPVLKTRLTRETAADALFGYMAAKQEYAQYEIDRYVDVLTSFGKDVSPNIVANLEKLLAAAGSPDKVFWAHKVVAMTALQQVGTPAAAAVVQKYAADAGGYTATKQKLDKDGKPTGPVQATPKTFKELAGETLRKLS